MGLPRSKSIVNAIELFCSPATDFLNPIPKDHYFIKCDSSHKCMRRSSTQGNIKLKLCPRRGSTLFFIGDAHVPVLHVRHSVPVYVCVLDTTFPQCQKTLGHSNLRFAINLQRAITTKDDTTPKSS